MRGGPDGNFPRNDIGGCSLDSGTVDDEPVGVVPGCSLWGSIAGRLLSTIASNSALQKSDQPPPATSMLQAGASGRAAGSFWQFMDQLEFQGPSYMDLMLDGPLEALLLQDDLLQELRARHPGLVTRLTEPGAVLFLIECITKGPSGVAANAFAISFVAAQVLTVGLPELYQVWVSPSHPELLDKFWSFPVGPTDSVDPLMAGYFTAAAAALLEHRPLEVASYLRSRTRFLDSILQRLHSRSIAELLATLACAESHDRIIFHLPTLLQRLLCILEDDSADPDAQQNAATVISEMLCRGSTLCFAEELLARIASKSSINPLMSTVLGADPHRSTVAATVLASAVFQASGGDYRTRSVSFSSFGRTCGEVGGSIPQPKGDDGMCEFAQIVPVIREPSSRSIPVPAHEGHCRQLVGGVCDHFRNIRCFFEDALRTGLIGSNGLSQRASTPLEKNRGIIAVKPGTMGKILEIILLITLIVRACRETTLEAMRREQLLLVCMRLLVAHPLSSLLHNAVASLFSEIFSIADNFAIVIFFSLAGPNGVLELVVSQFREHVKDRGPGSSVSTRRPDVYFMGQLHNMCGELLQFSAQGSAETKKRCEQALCSVPGWVEIVKPALAIVAELREEELGGGVPAEVRALSVISVDFLPFGGGAGGGATVGNAYSCQGASTVQPTAGSDDSEPFQLYFVDTPPGPDNPEQVGMRDGNPDEQVGMRDGNPDDPEQASNAPKSVADGGPPKRKPAHLGFHGHKPCCTVL